MNNLFNDENRNILTLVILFVGSVWGVLVKYLAHLSKTKEGFSFLVFLSELMAHSFAGMLAFFACMGLDVNPNLTIVITLISAYMGLKLINKLENEIIEWIDGLSERFKK